jgi:alpha-mannosidase
LAAGVFAESAGTGVGSSHLQFDGFYASLSEIRRWLDAKIEELNESEAYKPTLHAVGHSHIDMAWLWRLKHTREKAGRTFSTGLNLMRQYPEIFE